MTTFIIFYCIFTILMFGGATVQRLNADNEDATAKDYFGLILGPLIIPAMLGALLFKLLNKEERRTYRNSLK